MHVRRRGLVLGCDVGQVGYELIGDIASIVNGCGAQCSHIFHDRKLELTSMGFGLIFEEHRGIVDDCAVWAVPGRNGSLDTSADHVLHLAMHLPGVHRIVANVHVVLLAEPA
jgi:hypothetical protein